jgi:vacuolar-type H+-ATPase subunit D/Vma8
MKNLNEEELGTQIEHLKKIRDEVEVRFRSIERDYKELEEEMSHVNREIEKTSKFLEYKDKEVCDSDYYQIRGGSCKYAEVYHGKIHCTNPYCSEY